METKPIPNFFCFGAQKAGTTTLHNILKQHPDIYLPEQKEPPFFEVNEQYKKGLEYYFSEYFTTYNGQQLVGNINPNLQLDIRSIDRIIDSFGINIKAIFIMRNPVDRAYSHYLMSKRRGYESLSFIEALKNEPNRIRNPVEHPEYHYLTEELGHYEKNHWGYIHRSTYLKTIQYLYKRFSEKNVKIILFEEFITNTKHISEQILNFIGASASNEITYNLQSNTATTPKSYILRDIIYKPSWLKEILKKIFKKGFRESIKGKIISKNSRVLSQEEKTLSADKSKYIYDTYFKDEVINLENFLNISLSDWKI